MRTIKMLRGLGVVGIMAAMAACQGLDEESKGEGSADLDAALGDERDADTADATADSSLNAPVLPGPSVTTAAALGETNRIIVRYHDHAAARTTPSAARSASRLVQEEAGRRGLIAKRLRTTGLGAEVWEMDRPMTGAAVRALAEQIALADPDVEYAEPDSIMVPALTPNDPGYANQWHYKATTTGVSLPSAWNLATGAGVVVAVLDTGYRPHADLAANILPGYDFITQGIFGSPVSPNDGDGRDSDASDPGDWCPAKSSNSSWHGTHVAGTVAAVTNNGSGVAGVAYGAKILPVRVLGQCGGNLSDIADGILWASGNPVSGAPVNPTPARVINLSLELESPGVCPLTYANAIAAARKKGTIVVVAAGNFSVDAYDRAPANCPGVVAVAATTQLGGRADFSDYGATVSIAAPGESVLSTFNTGLTTPGSDAFAYSSGTSMSAPHVAGVAALMLSANPSLTNDALWTLLRTSAKPFPGACSGCGAGLLDATLAVNAAISYGAQNRIDQHDFFVQQVYLDVLKRKADQAGLAYYVNLLNACNGSSACLKSTRTAIARGLLESPENQAQPPTLNPAATSYKSDFIVHCYSDFLQRLYDISGGSYWYNYLDSTGDFDTVVSSFITSAEYRSRFGTP